jgi:hypothetical protein
MSVYDQTEEIMTRQQVRAWLARYPHLPRIMDRMAEDLDRLEKRGIAGEWVRRQRQRLYQLTALKLAVERALGYLVPGSAAAETLRRRYLGRGADDAMPTWKWIGYEMGYNPATLQQYERRFVDLVLLEMAEGE